MVGVVVAAHGQVAGALVRAAEAIVGPLAPIDVIDLEPSEGFDGARRRVADAIHRAQAGDGVVVLVDMFGGTPSNCCVASLQEGALEIVTGVNLPMLVKLAALRLTEPSAHALAEALANHGRRSILLAGDLLRAAIAPDAERAR